MWLTHGCVQQVFSLHYLTNLSYVCVVSVLFRKQKQFVILITVLKHTSNSDVIGEAIVQGQSSRHRHVRYADMHVLPHIHAPW